MAWNGSDKEKVEGQRLKVGQRKDKFRSSTSTSNFNSKALCAGLIVVALGCGAVWWFVVRDSGKSNNPTTQQSNNSLIAEVKPQIATNAVAEKVAKPREPTDEEKRLAKIKFYEDKYGTNMPKQIETVVYFLKHPPQKVFEADVPYKFLKHPCDRQIASLMSAPPGSYFLVKPQYGESFNRGYQASFTDKIEILPEDDEKTVGIKNLVNETKQQIADIVRTEGKMPNEIMNEHAAYMYELGQVEEQLRAEIRKARRDPDVSDADFADFVQAANVIRKQKGLPEQKLPSLSRGLLHRRANRSK